MLLVKMTWGCNCILLSDNNQLKCYYYERQPIDERQIAQTNGLAEEILDMAWCSSGNCFFILSANFLFSIYPDMSTLSLERVIQFDEKINKSQCMTARGEHLFIHVRKLEQNQEQLMVKKYYVRPNKIPERKYEYMLPLESEEQISQIFLNDTCERLAVNSYLQNTYTVKIFNIKERTEWTMISSYNDLQIETLFWSISCWLAMNINNHTLHLIYDNAENNIKNNGSISFFSAKFGEYKNQKICKTVQEQQNGLIKLHIC